MAKKQKKESLENMSDVLLTRLVICCTSTRQGVVEQRFTRDLALLAEMKLTHQIGNGYQATQAGFEYVLARAKRLKLSPEQINSFLIKG